MSKEINCLFFNGGKQHIKVNKVEEKNIATVYSTTSYFFGVWSFDRKIHWFDERKVIVYNYYASLIFRFVYDMELLLQRAFT